MRGRKFKRENFVAVAGKKNMAHSLRRTGRWLDPRDSPGADDYGKHGTGGADHPPGSCGSFTRMRFRDIRNFFLATDERRFSGY
jgi:hypothetical protein